MGFSARADLPRDSSGALRERLEGRIHSRHAERILSGKIFGAKIPRRRIGGGAGVFKIPDQPKRAPG